MNHSGSSNSRTSNISDKHELAQKVEGGKTMYRMPHLELDEMYGIQGI